MRKSRVSHSGIGSEKARKSEKVDVKDAASKIAGAQAMLEKIQEQEEADDHEESEEQDDYGLQDLRELVFLGQNSEIFEVGKFKFDVCTLKNNQKRDLVKYLSMTGRDLAMYVRPYTLAMSIRSVNNVPLEDLYETYGGEDDSLDSFERKLFIIDQWQSALVESLFSKYEELVEKSDSFFKPEDEAVKK